RPLLGSGLETFAYAFSRHRPVELNYYPQWESRFDRAHNEFFNILVTTGIVGFLVYVLLFGMLTASLWKQFQNQGDTGKRLEIAAVGAGLAAYAVHNSFAFSSTTTLAVFFLFISYVESGHAHKLILISRKNIGLVLSGICITTTCLYGFFAVQVVRGDMYFSAAERIEPSDPVRALNLYRDAVQVNPDNDRYWKELSRICFHLAVLYSTEEQLIDARATALLDEAIRAAERAAALNPHKPNNYGVLAVGLYEMGKYDSQYYQSAEEAALHAHNLEPTDVRLVELLALLSMRQGRWSDADNAFQTAYALKKDLPSLLQNMGIFYYDISQYAAAAEYFRQLQEIDPSNTTSQEYLQRLGSLAD
ncbi:MAG TPA: O-antigen ligase family protein, partial [bacterium]|nr:O-antigen ligase family protein [bacterium]